MKHCWIIWLWNISHYIHCSSSKMKNICQTWPWLCFPFNLDIKFYGTEMGENKIRIPCQRLPCPPRLPCLIQKQQFGGWVGPVPPAEAALKLPSKPNLLSLTSVNIDVEAKSLRLMWDGLYPCKLTWAVLTMPRFSKAGRQRAAEEMGRPESTCSLLP